MERENWSPSLWDYKQDDKVKGMVSATGPDEFYAVLLPEGYKGNYVEVGVFTSAESAAVAVEIAVAVNDSVVSL